MTRVYVPASFAALAAFRASGRVPTEDAVTAPDSSEEAEYAALMTAADASAELAAATPDPRRVVVAVDVATPGLVASFADVASVHVDLEPPSDPDDDLAWFATQEVDALLEG